MIGHMRHGSPPRLMALQSILSPNRRESLPTPSAGVRISPKPAEVLPEGALSGSCPHRATRWQAEAVQACGAPLREDGPELRLRCGPCSRVHPHQIRPHDLAELMESRLYEAGPSDLSRLAWLH